MFHLKDEKKEKIQITVKKREKILTLEVKQAIRSELALFFIFQNFRIFLLRPLMVFDDTHV